MKTKAPIQIQRDNLIAEVDQLKAAIKDKDQKISTLQLKVNSIEQTILQKDKTIQDLQSTISNKDNQINNDLSPKLQSSNKTLQELKQYNVKLESERANFKQENDTLKILLKEKDNTINNLEKELNQKNITITDDQQIINNLKTFYDVNKTEMQQKQQEYEKTVNQLKNQLYELENDVVIIDNVDILGNIDNTSTYTENA